MKDITRNAVAEYKRILKASILCPNRPLLNKRLPAARRSLEKNCNVLDTTIDFLNGNTGDKANALLSDADLISYFKEVIAASGR